MIGFREAVQGGMTEKQVNKRGHFLAALKLSVWNLGVPPTVNDNWRGMPLSPNGL
jgi:hypothetical protein